MRRPAHVDSETTTGKQIDPRHRQARATRLQDGSVHRGDLPSLREAAQRPSTGLLSTSEPLRTDREILVEYLEFAATYLRTEADRTIEATIDQADDWPQEDVDALLAVLAETVAVEDHLERYFAGPLPPPKNMMGRLIAKHTPMDGEGEPLILANVTTLIAQTASNLRNRAGDL
jgi:hypothetical protein